MIPNAQVNVKLAMRMADEYEAAQHSASYSVRFTYDAFKRDLLRHWHEMTVRSGVRVEAWPDNRTQPYSDSQEMKDDVSRHLHLYVYTAGQPLPADHPLTEKPPIAGAESYNIVFRAVHDYFAHFVPNFSFGPKGEWNGAIYHTSMFSRQALPALLTETVMQNAWVNFGSHMRDNDRLINSYDDRWLSPGDRPFAEQKVFPVSSDTVRDWIAVYNEAMGNALASHEDDYSYAFQHYGIKFAG